MNAETLYRQLVLLNRAERERTKIVLARDAEGNDFHELFEAVLESPDVTRFGENVLTLWPADN